MGIRISNNDNLPNYIWECTSISPNLAGNCASTHVYFLDPPKVKIPFVLKPVVPRPTNRPMPPNLKYIKIGSIIGSNSGTALPNESTIESSFSKKNYLYFGQHQTTRYPYQCPSNINSTIISAVYTWRIYRKISTCPPGPPPPICTGSIGQTQGHSFTLEKGPSIPTSDGCMVQTYICKFSSNTTNSSCCMNSEAMCVKCKTDEICKPTTIITRSINGITYSWAAGTCTKNRQCPEFRPCDSCDPRGCPANPQHECCQWQSYIQNYPNGCQRTCWTCTRACPRPPVAPPPTRPPSNIPPGTCYNGFDHGPNSLLYAQGLIPLCRPITPTISNPLAPHNPINNDPCGDQACVSGPAGKFCGYWSCSTVDLALGKVRPGPNCQRLRPPGCTRAF